MLAKLETPIGRKAGMPSQRKKIVEALLASIPAEPTSPPHLMLVKTSPAPEPEPVVQEEVEGLTMEQKRSLYAVLSQQLEGSSDTTGDWRDTQVQAWLAHKSPIPNNVCRLDVTGCAEIYRARTKESEKRRRDNVNHRTPAPAPVWVPVNPVKGWSGSTCPTVVQLVDRAPYENAKLGYKTVEELRLQRRLARARNRGQLSLPKEAANDTSAFVGPLPQASSEPPWALCQEGEYTSWLINHSDKYWNVTKPSCPFMLRLAPFVGNTAREESLDPTVTGLVRDDEDFRLNNDLTVLFGRNLEKAAYIRWLNSHHCLSPAYTSEERYDLYLLHQSDEVRYNGWLAVNTFDQPRAFSRKRAHDLIVMQSKRIKAGKAPHESMMALLRTLGMLTPPVAAVPSSAVSIEPSTDMVILGPLKTHFVTTMDDVRKRACRAAKRRREERKAQEFNEALETPENTVHTADELESVRMLSRLIVDEALMGKVVAEEVQHGIREIMPTLQYYLKTTVSEAVTKTVLGHLTIPMQCQIQRSVEFAVKRATQHLAPVQPEVSDDVKAPEGYVKDGTFYLPA